MLSTSVISESVKTSKVTASGSYRNTLLTNKDSFEDEMITSFLSQKYNLAIFDNLELFYE